MRVQVRYFAIFREQAGSNFEHVETSARTLAELYAELQARHGFSLPESLVKAAVGSEFRPLSDPLVADSEIVFIPPVAGG